MFKYQQLQPEERLPRHSGRATYDQDKEMSRHKELTAATGMKMYFCDPQHPWQYGTRENTNGLLCQYLPNGTDLSVYSQNELDAIADARPRTTHAVHSPIEVFATPLASARQPPKSLGKR